MRLEIRARQGLVCRQKLGEQIGGEAALVCALLCSREIQPAPIRLALKRIVFQHALNQWLQTIFQGFEGFHKPKQGSP